MTATTGPEPVTPPQWMEHLRSLHRESFTGTLLVEGPSETSFHLREGLLLAVQTPAAPGADTLLLRSGAVAEQVWSAARERGDATGDLVGELLSRGAAGAGLLELALRRSLFDGVFVSALAGPTRSAVSEAGVRPPLLPLTEGVSPEDAWVEAERRITFFTRRWAPPASLAKLRPTATASPDTAACTAHAQLMAGADGLRTARDLAFLSGREVSGVLADMMWLIDRGMLEAMTVPQGPLSRRRPEPAAPVAETPGVPSLSKRLPGASTIRRPPRADTVLPPRTAALLRAYLDGNTGAARDEQGQQA